VGPGRIVTAGLVCSLLVVLAIGGHQAWGRLGVPYLRPGFADLRAITSGWDCFERHVSSWPVNPCDPWGRTWDHPRIWVAPSLLGLGEDDTYTLGVLASLAFFIAAICVVPRRSAAGVGLVYGAALCSPAVLLAVERGNPDIITFALVATAVLLARRPRGPIWAAALVLFAELLKFYPIFSLGFLARQSRRVALISGAAALSLFGLYLLVTLGDVRTIHSYVVEVDWYSYGIHIVGSRIANTAPWLPTRAWDLLIVVAVVAAALASRKRLARALSISDLAARDGERNVDLFVAGAGVYLGTFALARNFDYRLVFLVLTIPQLLEWSRGRKLIPLLTLVSVLGSLWLPPRWESVPVIDWGLTHWIQVTSLPAASVPQLLTFVGLAALLAAVFFARAAPARDVTAADPERGHGQIVADSVLSN